MHSLFASAAVFGLFAKRARSASTEAKKEPPVEGPLLSPEARRIIKDYVANKHLEPVIKQRLNVGTKLNASIELQMVPREWGSAMSEYCYVYCADRILIVDPISRQVALVIS